jgi:hypothetical protein
MKLLLAAYDPSRQSNGSYWAWAHPGIPSDLPGQVYEQFNDEDKPAQSGDILNLQKRDHCRGGCVGLDRSWCCIYRFLYGGIDRSNRQCFVLICAFSSRRDLARTDWLAVLNQGPWNELLVRGDGGLLVPPATRQWDFEVARLEPDPRLRRQLDGHGKLVDFGEKGVRKVVHVASEELGGTEPFHCRVHWFPPSDLFAELIVDKKRAVWVPEAPAEVAYPAEVRTISADRVQYSKWPLLAYGLPFAVTTLGLIALFLLVPRLTHWQSVEDSAERPSLEDRASRGGRSDLMASSGRPGEFSVPSRGQIPVHERPAEIEVLIKRVDTVKHEFAKMRDDHAQQIKTLKEELDNLKKQFEPGTSPY